MYNYQIIEFKNMNLETLVKIVEWVIGITVLAIVIRAGVCFYQMGKDMPGGPRDEDMER